MYYQTGTYLCDMNRGQRKWIFSSYDVMSNKGLVINAKKCLYEGVIAPTVLYGAEPSCMRSAERRRANVLEMKFGKMDTNG